MLLQAAKLLEENTQYLSDIDSRFGDGDHGITMGKIAKLIQERVPQWGEDSIKDFLDSLGMAIMEVKGGSAGPLYGTMIGGLGVNLDDDAGQVDEAGLKTMFAGCLSEMEDITTAKVGDKTMMDALIPAVQAAQQTQGDCKAILEAAAPGRPGGRQGPASSLSPSSAGPAAIRNKPSAPPTPARYPPPCSSGDWHRESDTQYFSDHIRRTSP